MKAKQLLILILIVSFCFSTNGEVVANNLVNTNLLGFKNREGVNTSFITNIFSALPKKKKPAHKKKKKKPAHKKKKKKPVHKKKKKKPAHKKKKKPAHKSKKKH